MLSLSCVLCLFLTASLVGLQSLVVASPGHAGLAFQLHQVRARQTHFYIRFTVIQYRNPVTVKQLISKGPKIGFSDQLSLNAGQKYCRML